MTPKKICALFSFLSLASAGIFITFSNFDAVKEYASLSYNHTEVEQEEQKIIKPGTTERLIFHNVNNRVFLLESFRSIQSRDLYILTETEKFNRSEVSHINCVMCKD